MLGGNISHLIGTRNERMCRSRIDDAAPTLRLHPRQRRSYSMKDRREVYRNDRIPFFRGKLVDGRDMLDTRIVNEYVRMAKGPCAAHHHLSNLIGPGHVGTRICRHGGTHIYECGALGFDRGCISEAVYHDACALSRECSCICESDARGRTGDECDFSFQEHGALHSKHVLDNTLQTGRGCAQLFGTLVNQSIVKFVWSSDADSVSGSVGCRNLGMSSCGQSWRASHG